MKKDTYENLKETYNLENLASSLQKVTNYICAIKNYTELQIYYEKKNLQLDYASNIFDAYYTVITLKYYVVIRIRL